jgi:hypothetical protein
MLFWIRRKKISLVTKIPGLLPGRRNIFSTISSKVEILKIVDSSGDEYQNSKQELDLKVSCLEGEKIKIHYRILGKPQTVRLQIEHEPSKIHEDFYRTYKNKTFSPPVVVKLVSGEKKRLGDHEVIWDGRDQTSDRRLLLAGKYKVKIEGVEKTRKNLNETTLQIAKPNSFSYGIHYYKKGHLESTKKEVSHSASKLQNLTDGTSYQTKDHLAYDAENALWDWKMSSVIYWSGHSGAVNICFHRTEGKPYKKKDLSQLNILGSSEESKWWKSPNASLQTLEEEELQDLFLVVLNGCNTGNEIALAQLILRSFNPGPLDGIHGPKTTKAVKSFQKFNDLKPVDGTITPSLLNRLNLSSEEKTQKRIILDVQKKLKSYFPGKADGELGKNTRRAIENFQLDHPTLAVTGELDSPTINALKIGKKGFFQKNISLEANCKGADIAIGFSHKIDFAQAVRWAIEFWDNLNKGSGVNKAANDAVAMLPQNYRKSFEFNIYTQTGVSKETTLHPARYGKAK